MSTASGTSFVATAAGLLSSALLLTVSLVVAQAGQSGESIRTVDITLARFAFSPDRIEVRAGERVRLHVVSADGTHGFQVTELGLNVRIPAGGKTVTVDMMPKQVGTYLIDCSEYCGTGHRRMKARLIVTPGL